MSLVSVRKCLLQPGALTGSLPSKWSFARRASTRSHVIQRRESPPKFPFEDPSSIRELRSSHLGDRRLQVNQIAASLEDLIRSSEASVRKNFSGDAMDALDLYETLRVYELLSPITNDALLAKVRREVARRDFRPESLSERQWVLLVQLGGWRSANMPVRKRRNYLDALMRTLFDRDIRLTTSVITSLLEANLDNDDVNHIDPITFLRYLAQHGLSPNVDTNAQLARVYSLRGNPDAIRLIMRSSNEDHSQPEIRVQLFNCLVHATARKGDSHSVSRLLDQHGASSGVTGKFISDTALSPYFCAAMGFAAIPNIEQVVKTLYMLPSRVLVDRKRMAKHTLDVYLTLLEAGCLDSMEKLGPLMGLNLSSGDTLHLDGAAISPVFSHLRLLHSDGQKEAFAELFGLLPPGDQKKNFLKRLNIERNYHRRANINKEASRKSAPYRLMPFGASGPTADYASATFTVPTGSSGSATPIRELHRHFDEGMMLLVQRLDKLRVNMSNRNVWPVLHAADRVLQLEEEVKGSGGLSLLPKWMKPYWGALDEHRRLMSQVLKSRDLTKGSDSLRHYISLKLAQRDAMKEFE